MGPSALHLAASLQSCPPPREGSPRLQQPSLLALQQQQRSQLQPQPQPRMEAPQAAPAHQPMAAVPKLSAITPQVNAALAAVERGLVVALDEGCITM